MAQLTLGKLVPFSKPRWPQPCSALRELVAMGSSQTRMAPLYLAAAYSLEGTKGGPKEWGS